MIVIIEGARGVGKSTLIDSLVPILQLDKPTRVHKFERDCDPTRGMLRFLFQQRDSREHLTTHVIVDRFHLTEYVLSMHFKRRPFLDLAADTHHIHQELLKLGGVVILLMANAQSLHDRVAMRTPFKPADMPHDVAERAWSTFKLLSGTIPINTDAMPHDRIVAWCAAHIAAKSAELEAKDNESCE